MPVGTNEIGQLAARAHRKVSFEKTARKRLRCFVLVTIWTGLAVCFRSKQDNNGSRGHLVLQLPDCRTGL